MATSFEPIKFANLTEKTTEPSDADIIVIEDSTATKKAKWSSLISWIKSKLNIGSTDISGIGNGTVTGAINTLNTKMMVMESMCITDYLADTGITDYCKCQHGTISLSAHPERSGIIMHGVRSQTTHGDVTSLAAGSATVMYYRQISANW